MARSTLKTDGRFEKTLADLANGGSKADVIQRAVATYQYLKNEVSNEDSGKCVLITDASGKVLQNINLP